MTYEEAIDWLYSTQSFGIKLGLDNAKNLLRKYLAFASYGTKVIHVAGTNGKGSVCAMMELLVRGAGLRTGMFTSPHLITYNERVRINGMNIADDVVAKHLTDLRFLCEKQPEHPTFFEISLALAMRHFKDEGCEVIILETGMGGRLDATTAVPADVCVITPIAMDHAEWLGDTLEKVAAEKAGIMLEGVQCFSSDQEEDAKIMLMEEANERRTPFTMIDEPLVGYSVNIPGEHQKYNANLAVHTVHSLGIQLTYDNVKYALDKVVWPGRFEKGIWKGKEIILDGAHNPHAAKALMKTWGIECMYKKATVIFGAVEDKDVSGVLGYVIELAERVILTPVNNPRSVDTDGLNVELKSTLPDYSGDVLASTSVKDALEKSVSYDETILVVGSLFLIGEAKSYLLDKDFERSSQ